MNLGQARARLASRGFQYADPATLNYWLNAGKDAMADEYPWPWLETTVTGTAPMTIADLKAVLSVVDTTNQVELTGADFRDIDVDVATVTSGIACEWWLDGLSTLRTQPPSSSVLSVRYLRTTPDLVNDGESPVIPARLHPVWIDYAAVEAYKDQPNIGMANALLADIRARRLPAIIETYVWRNRAGRQAVVPAVGEDV